MLTSIGEEYGSGWPLLIVTIRFLHGTFGFLKQREGDADLESILGIQIKQVIFAAKGFVWDALLVKEFAKFSVDARVVALPKRAKRIFAGFREASRATGWRGKLRNQRHFAIGAHGKPLAIFGFALGADHNHVEFTTRGCHIQ